VKLLDPANAGTEAMRQALTKLDPAHDLGYDRVLGTPGAAYPPHTYKVEGTIEQLIINQNELAQEVAALKQRPFG
jgi:hypothetical protein